jgi:hypothetical protein
MTEREYHLAQSKTQGQAQPGWIVALCIFWVMASIISVATQAFGATPSGLRGSVSEAASAQTPQAWLGSSVWRVGPCETAQNFQAFTFSAAPKVEVGSGKLGEGEQLDLLVVASDPDGLIQIETRVCAPVGCNRTIERYKKLGPNQIQEWHFEGRLPNITPYIIVANGAAVDGSGPGRVFNRCGS